MVGLTDHYCGPDPDDPVEAKCFFDPVDCDDDDKCTEDLCDSITGCQNLPVPCDDG